MKFSVLATDKFKQAAKKLIKKYPSLKDELFKLGVMLEQHPDLGTSLGNHLYKIRMAIKSKGKGKSGGARVITYLVTENKEVYLLMIYDKADFESLDDNFLKSIVDSL